MARAFGGLDIRRAGSGTIGATNVLRTLGKLPAILTLCGDVAKGYLAVSVARAIIPGPWGAAAGAVLAVVGNCWPVFLRFRGGKGVATGFGAFLALQPWATGPAALVWLVVVASFRYVSLASIMACLCLPLGVALLGFCGGRWTDGRRSAPPLSPPSSSSRATVPTSRAWRPAVSHDSGSARARREQRRTPHRGARRRELGDRADHSPGAPRSDALVCGDAIPP